MPAGDCYQAAFQLIMDRAIFGDASCLTLVHGVVTGQGPIKGVKYGHAWVEDNSGPIAIVIDASNDNYVEMPAYAYYRLGKIKQTIRYTWEEARKEAQEHEHYGPWQGETSPEAK